MRAEVIFHLDEGPKRKISVISLYYLGISVHETAFTRCRHEKITTEFSCVLKFVDRFARVHLNLKHFKESKENNTESG